MLYFYFLYICFLDQVKMDIYRRISSREAFREMRTRMPISSVINREINIGPSEWNRKGRDGNGSSARARRGCEIGRLELIRLLIEYTEASSATWEVRIRCLPYKIFSSTVTFSPASFSCSLGALPRTASWQIGGFAASLTRWWFFFLSPGDSLKPPPSGLEALRNLNREQWDPRRPR